jgi:hypothetical protein
MTAEPPRGGSDEARIAQNEVTFRRVNEALEPPRGSPADQARFVCECGRLGCTETLALDLAAYEAVRTGFDRFLVLPGHTDAVDTVVEDHGRYLVVVKEGVGRQIAAAHHPRHEDSTTGTRQP